MIRNRSRRPRRQLVNSYRPSFDVLEDRLAPANFTPGTVQQLIDAIDSANINAEDDVIDLAGATFTLTAIDDFNDGFNGLPSIFADGGNSLTIQNGTIQRSSAVGTPEFRILFIDTGATLTISGLTIGNGNTDFAGGGINNKGTVTITNSTLSDNSSGLDGGGIFNGQSATLTITNSTLSDNAADHGGGIFNLGDNAIVTITNSTLSDNSADFDGGGIFNVGDNAIVTITNSTLSDNSAGFDGGGILNVGDNATVTITNSTLSNNSADRGGGISNRGDNATVTITNSTLSDNSAVLNGGGIFTDGGIVTITNSIVANSSSGGNCAGGPIAASGVNFETGDAGGTCLGFTEVTAAELNLGLLAFNGGPTQTHALLPGSVAIDAGDNDEVPVGLTTDQRGFPRIVGAAVDVGAVEVVPANLVVDITADENGGNFDVGDLSLREAIFLADLDADANTVTFDPAVFAGNKTIELSIIGDDDTGDFGNGDSAFKITTPITIQGPSGADRLTLAGPGPGVEAATMRHFLVTSTGNLTLDYLTLTGGVADGSGPGDKQRIGGAVLNDSGTLAITHSTLSGNSAVSGGGVGNFGAAAITDSTLSGNSATFSGGGIYNFDTLTITNSTLSGNSAEFFGGGILNFDALLLANSTLTGNQVGDTGTGGGLWGDPGSPHPDDQRPPAANILNNTIVAGNFRGVGTAANDIDAMVGIDNSFNNLIGAGGSGGLVEGVKGNKVGVANPMLGPLADNGGPTETHALLPGSPATNAGNNGKIPDGINTDQRGPGFARIISTTVDIGAFEAPNNPPVITSNGGGAAAAVNVPENTTAVTDVNATDPDSFATLTFSIIGGADAAKFSIHSVTGVLKFIAAPNFEAPTDAGGNNVYEVTVEVSDGSLQDTQDISVTVLDVFPEVPTVPASGTAGLADDPQNPGQQMLIVAGTSGDDKIVFEKKPGNIVRVKLNGAILGNFPASTFARIVAFGLAGNDQITVAAGITLPTQLFGNEGNDKLTGGGGPDELFGGANDDKLYGGNGQDKLFGEAGDDRLYGQASNDLLLGGAGADRLFGDAGWDVLIGGSDIDRLFGGDLTDILIGGTTAHDADETALNAIVAEWTSGNSFDTRIANLAGLLNGSTVINDGVIDILQGDTGRDWYLDFSLIDTLNGFDPDPVLGDRQN